MEAVASEKGPNVVYVISSRNSKEPRDARVKLMVEGRQFSKKSGKEVAGAGSLLEAMVKDFEFYSKKWERAF